MGRIKMTKGLVRCNKCRRLTDETVDGQCGYCKEDELDQTLNQIQEEIEKIKPMEWEVNYIVAGSGEKKTDKYENPEYIEKKQVLEIINKHRRGDE